MIHDIEAPLDEIARATQKYLGLSGAEAQALRDRLAREASTRLVPVQPTTAVELTLPPGRVLGV